MNLKNEGSIFLREAKKEDWDMILAFMKFVDSEFYPPLSKRPGGIEERLKRGLASPKANFIIAENVQASEEINKIESHLKEGLLEKRLESLSVPAESLRIAGLLSFEKAWKGEKNAYLSFVAVNPAFRKRNIASALIIFLEVKMHSEAMQRLYVCTWSTNQPALTLYEKKGFLKVKILKAARGPEVDSIYLVKNIF